jgi:predicted RNA binding protein YcfA (HicA-like mRNA interferase family)
VVRQQGSHLRVTSKLKSTEHHVTIPAHDPLKIGTLQGILTEVAGYLQRDRAEVIKELFG